MTTHGTAKRACAPSQDSLAVRSWNETVIAVLADGVGGARAGREAAQRAVETLVKNYAERPRAWSPQKSLGEFTRLVNQRLYRDSMERFSGPELVTTLCVAVIEGDRLFGLNVGDSRIYLLREGALEQLSVDHALPEPEHAHILSRAIGMEAEVEPHFFERDLRDGDVAFLCSDGVSNVLDAPTLQQRLEHRCSARTIIAAARDAATPELLDDMSAVVLDIAETGKLRAIAELPLAIPGELLKSEEVDGFTLVRPFQQNDRVWLATREGERYTLKFPEPEARENEPLLNAFIRETWNATRIGARFFPRAFLPLRATTRFYAMEFIEAPSLQHFLRTRALAVEEAIALGRFLLTASQYLLTLDLVHGDVKPDNILVLSGYDSLEFKLIDFGSVTELFSILSRAGTASYLAPERFHESPISERTEIFAIGVTLYEALTRAFPYGEIERYQTPHFGVARDPRTVNPNIPPWLAAVLLRATAPEPERRYQNYSEILYDLEHPAQVQPFHARSAALLERHPLRFYQVGFFVFLALSLLLVALLLTQHSHP